jgi:hypothetical protein
MVVGIVAYPRSKTGITRLGRINLLCRPMWPSFASVLTQTRVNRGWPPMFFILEIAALQGMSLTRIASFLGREEGEVRDNAKELEALRRETGYPE